MKKLILASLAAASLAMTAQGQATMDVKGVTYNVDTLFHAIVGPGTTETELRLSAGTNPLRVYYLKIDKTAPGVSIRSVVARDKVAGTETPSAMAKRKSVGGLHYFAGVNADFFTTSGAASNGTSKVGSPTTSAIADGEIYKTSNSNYQFSVDRDGVARVCRLNYYTGTATIGEKVTLFKGVNVASPNNGITLYTPRYWGSANQGDYQGSCYQVTAKLAEGSEPFRAGGKFKLVVTSEPDTMGDMVVPADGYVIHGRGTSKTGCNTGAKGFVKALKPGDVVEFDNIVLTPEGEQIYPEQVVSGNPKNVGGGLTLDTEGERTDAKDRHPRTNIGISADGNTIIMMVIDGRWASNSVGVSTSMAADIMRYAGAAESVNLDGGGSSALYTEALGVRNHVSDGTERAVGNAIYAVLEAPDDNVIASISFRDWVKTIPLYGVYKPVIYGYNQYGQLINTDVQGVTLTCETGEADENGLLAMKEGTFALKASLGEGIEATIPLTVTSSTAGMEITPKYTAVMLNGHRDYTIELQTTVDGEIMPIAADVFDWSTADAAVATVSENGTISGVAEGKTTISGIKDQLSVNVDVTVEIAPAALLPVDTARMADAWKVTKTAMKSADLSILDNGIAFDYVLSSTRGPRVGAEFKQNMYSHPESVQLRVNPGTSKVTTITVTLLAANGDRQVDVSKDVNLTAEQENTLSFPVKDYFDTNDIGIYPIQFSKLSFVPSASTGVAQRVEIPGIEALYDPATVGVDDIRVDADSDAAMPTRWFNLQGQPVDLRHAAPGLYLGTDGTKTIIR